MPFIDRIRQWADVGSPHPAVVVGDVGLDYGALLAAAATVSAGPRDGVAVIDEPNGVELAVKWIAALRHGRTSMVLDASWPAGLRRDLRASAVVWARQQPATRSGDADRKPFLLGLSSGTSGRPKAFVRHAASWHESFLNSTRRFDVDAETVTLAPGPMAASMNLYALGESLFSGGTFVALPAFSPGAALQALEERGINRVVAVPTVLELLSARGLATGRTAAGLSSIVSAGASLTAATLSQVRAWAPQARIHQYYGAAELGFVTVATLEPGAEGGPWLAGGVGEAFPGVCLSIRDAHGRELPAGSTGDVYVQGPYACSGYAWGDDGMAFASTSDTDPAVEGLGVWNTVRDRGCLDAHGRLHLAGRAADMVITSGANVYPQAVEQALASCGTASVMVTGICDDVRGQMLVAAVLAPAPHSAQLRRSVASLPSSQRPVQYFEVSELPLTGSGKPSRQLLRNWIEGADPRVRRLN